MKKNNNIAELKKVRLKIDDIDSKIIKFSPRSKRACRSSPDGVKTNIVFNFICIHFLMVIPLFIKLFNMFNTKPLIIN